MADDIVTELAIFLRRAAQQPFAWGAADCCLIGADWIEARRGIDPAASLRGTYRTRAGARRHMLRAGGFVPLTRGLMGRAGFREAIEARPGDVAVIQSPDGPVIGIRTPVGYASKPPSGLICAAFEPIVIWSIV
jgi:hypothetical protein